MGHLTPNTRTWVGPVVLGLLCLCTALVLADSRARSLAENTLLLSAAVAVASVLVGAPLAFLLTRTDVAGARVAFWLLVSLLFTPLYLQAAAWQAAFGLQGWYTALGRAPPILDGWRGAIIIHTMAAIPWVVVLMSVGLRLAEPELEEEALLDASPAQVFRRVTLVRAMHALGAALLWVAVATAGEMTVTDLFQVRTYAEEIYTEFVVTDVRSTLPWRFLPNAAAALAIIVAGVLLAAQLIPADRHTSQRESRPFRLGRWRAPAGALLLVMMLLLVGVPAASLVVKAGMLVTREGSALVRSWSAWQCSSMVLASPWRFARELGWSLLVAVPAALVVLGLGLALAWRARRGGWHALPALLAIALPLALPGPLVGLALIQVFNVPQLPWLVWVYDHSILVIMIAQAFRALPLCTLVLWYALRTVPDDLLTSAELEGAGSLTRFFRIAVLSRLPAVAMAWLVALIVAWGELAASILVVPPGVMTLPIQIFGLIHYGVDDRVAGVSLAVALMMLPVALLIAALGRRAH